MAVFVWKVSYGSGEDTDLGIHRIKLGEGYTQRRQDLINSVRGSWPVRMKDRVAVIEAAKAFIRTNGRIGFDWTPPGYSAPVRVSCDATKTTYPSYDTAELTMTFIQEFEP